MIPVTNGTGTNGHHAEPPRESPEQEMHRQIQRSPFTAVLTLIGGLGLGGAGGYGAARVEQVQRPAPPPPVVAPAVLAPAPRSRTLPLIIAEKTCSPPCKPKQTCYKGTCVDVATSVQQRLQVLEDQVQQLAGGDGALSAGAMR